MNQVMNPVDENINYEKMHTPFQKLGDIRMCTMTLPMDCIREGCGGGLREFPFVLLSYPPINQYECKKCKQKYQRMGMDDLRFHSSDKPFDWAEACEVILSATKR